MSNSFKQMVKDGSIKRADAMKVRLCEIYEECGFNERTEGPELEASIAELADFILSGGMLPPLEVRPRDGGGVFVVDGHRRRRGYIKAVAAGAPIEWIEVRAFAGNDLDRVARIVSSNGGLPLTQLETARVYKRLSAFGLGPHEIAVKVGKTRAHVDQLLLLAGADSNVHKLIEGGGVSASVAVETVRKLGERAGKFLAEQVDKAKAAGKGRATLGSIEGKALPRQVIGSMLTTVEAFTAAITPETQQVLNTLNLGEPRMVEVDAAALLHLIECQQEVTQARARQAAKAREQIAKAAQQEIS